MMKILMAASECVPFVKTGGLADVIGALPKALAAEGVDVRVVVPKYVEIPQSYRERMTHLVDFTVELGWRRQYCGIDTLTENGITFYFIDNEYYFKRPYVYGLGGDEPERFSFFDKAVLEMLPRIDFFPDVLHCHYWQTGMIPMLYRLQYAGRAGYGAIKTAYTIHNLQYQGIFPIDYVEDLLHLGREAYLDGGAEFFGACSFMKAGLNFADRITTVSPTYAQEIQSAYYGEKLDGLMRAKADHLIGILNGIDTVSYDPAKDRALVRNYTDPDGKAENKKALQEELGLTVDPAVPLCVCVSRLTEQKGFDLLNAVAEEMLSCAQIAVLGTGERAYEDYYRALEARHPGRFSAQIRFSEPLSRRMYAGADIFLMPSRFEPCGLSQMISMRYGTVPVVRQTGGLADSVEPYNRYTGEGTGFGFLNFNAHELLFTTQEACRLYTESPVAWGNLAAQGMAQDFSWRASALEYRKLYRGLFT